MLGLLWIFGLQENAKLTLSSFRCSGDRAIVTSLKKVISQVRNSNVADFRAQLLGKIPSSFNAFNNLDLTLRKITQFFLIKLIPHFLFSLLHVLTSRDIYPQVFVRGKLYCLKCEHDKSCPSSCQADQGTVLHFILVMLKVISLVCMWSVHGSTEHRNASTVKSSLKAPHTYTPV